MQNKQIHKLQVSICIIYICIYIYLHTHVHETRRQQRSNCHHDDEGNDLEIFGVRMQQQQLLNARRIICGRKTLHHLHPETEAGLQPGWGREERFWPSPPKHPSCQDYCCCCVITFHVLRLWPQKNGCIGCAVCVLSSEILRDSCE